MVPLGDAQCVRRQWGVCARVCEMWVVAGWLLLMWASVLCLQRCGGVRRARSNADTRATPTHTRAQHTRAAHHRSAPHRAHFPLAAAASLPHPTSHTRARTLPTAGSRIVRGRELPSEAESRLVALRDPDLEPSRPQADSLKACKHQTGSPVSQCLASVCKSLASVS